MRIDPPDLTAERVANIVSRSYAYTLPEILRCLRRIHGVSRQTLCLQTNVSEKRLWALEMGSYKMVRKGELEALANYYDIDLIVLQECHGRPPKNEYGLGKMPC